jgi:hypothetical protein
MQRLCRQGRAICSNPAVLSQAMSAAPRSWDGGCRAVRASWLARILRLCSRAASSDLRGVERGK